MRVALVYDRVNKWGGAERVLLALHEIWPEAPLYTAVYDPERASWAEVFKVTPSFLNKFPLAKTRHEFYPWLTPLAFESFDFSEFDVVISVTSAEAKGIITKPKTLHLCYCLTPTRYLWSGYKEYFSSLVPILTFGSDRGFSTALTVGIFRFLSFPVVSYLRAWDKIAAQRPDVYLATCKNVQKRIKKYYGRDSEIIYPPINTKKFEIRNSKFEIRGNGYFLLVSRLVAYKRIDIAIKAFNELGLPLKIVGTGNQMGRLKKMARKNIEFLGQLTDKELIRYYNSCQAVVFPQEEDFGLVPLEAQACGKPVIAFKGGGALETVIKGKTGVFFYPQTATALARAVGKFKGLRGLKVQDCRKNAERFSQRRFEKEFVEEIKRLTKK